ncbi:MAG: serine--tRNA ligase [Verrucomicrobiales bacterium]
MLDIRLIREDTEEVKRRLAQRGEDASALIDEVLACDETRRRAETEKQRLQSERNRMSREIGLKKRAGEDTAAIEATVKSFAAELDRWENAAAGADAQQRELLLGIPNLPHQDCPPGIDATANPVLRAWGEMPAFDFAARDHVSLGAALGVLDFESARKTTGPAFVVYRGAGARLERALINFLLDLHTREHGYTEVLPPFLVHADSLIGTSQLPKFEEQLYRVERDGLYLAPTAEVPVTNLHREEILSVDRLPIKYAAYTPCFRREAGAAGLGTRGLIRMHQFDKVELVKIASPESALAELDSLTKDAETVLQRLGLHYRVIELCTGDLGFGAARTFDIEVWAPGQGSYLEVSSCSWFTDYQARRMNLRFKDPETGKNRFCHTLNGSGTALARLFVALLETCQRSDGSVAIPKPLQPYMGSRELR